MIIFKVLGWILVPYIMLIVYGIQNKEELFTNKSQSHLIRFSLGAIWTLIIIIAILSSPEDVSNVSKGTNAVAEKQHKIQEEDKKEEVELIPEVLYTKALAIFNAGDYEESQKIFKEIANYKDSKAYIVKVQNALIEKNYTQAVLDFNKGLFDEALAAFLRIESYKDSKKYVSKAKVVIEKNNKKKKIKYTKAIKFFEREKYDQAKKIFMALGNYKDSFMYLEKIKKLPPYPKSQAKFIEAATSLMGEYGNAPNELKKSAIRRKRGKAIKKSLSKRRTIKGWIGTIKDLKTNSEGKAILEVELMDSDIIIKTWNNGLSDMFDKTLIPQSSKVFEILSDLGEGKKIVFSGAFAKSLKKDFVKESSMTERGSMNNPEFILKFKRVAPFVE